MSKTQSNVNVSKVASANLNSNVNAAIEVGKLILQCKHDYLTRKGADGKLSIDNCKANLAALQLPYQDSYCKATGAGFVSQSIKSTMAFNNLVSVFNLLDQLVLDGTLSIEWVENTTSRIVVNSKTKLKERLIDAQFELTEILDTELQLDDDQKARVTELKTIIKEIKAQLSTTK